MQSRFNPLWHVDEGTARTAEFKSTPAFFSSVTTFWAAVRNSELAAKRSICIFDGIPEFASMPARSMSCQIDYQLGSAQHT